MPERKMLKAHLGADGVYAAYRREREAVRRAHLQVIWLLLSGRTVAEVSAVTGFCGRWLLKLMDRWNERGLAGLGDRRRLNAGAEPLLDEAGLTWSPDPGGAIWQRPRPDTPFTPHVRGNPWRSPLIISTPLFRLTE